MELGLRGRHNTRTGDSFISAVETVDSQRLLDGKVPVRHRQLGINKLQAVLERVGQYRMARQKS